MHVPDDELEALQRELEASLKALNALTPQQQADPYYQRQYDLRFADWQRRHDAVLARWSASPAPPASIRPRWVAFVLALVTLLPMLGGILFWLLAEEGFVFRYQQRYAQSYFYLAPLWLFIAGLTLVSILCQPAASASLFSRWPNRWTRRLIWYPAIWLLYAGMWGMAPVGYAALLSHMLAQPVQAVPARWLATDHSTRKGCRHAPTLRLAIEGNATRLCARDLPPTFLAAYEQGQRDLLVDGKASALGWHITSFRLAGQQFAAPL